MKFLIIILLSFILNINGCISSKATNGDDPDIFTKVIDITNKEFIENLRLYKITDLNALITKANEVTLSWTSTGGNVYSYDIRYSDFKLNEKNWNNALIAPDITVPRAAPSLETFKIKELQQGTKYYFGIKNIDTNGYGSDISNIAEITTNLDDNNGTKNFTINGNIYKDNGTSPLDNNYKVLCIIKRNSAEESVTLSSSNGAYALTFKPSTNTNSVYSFDIIEFKIYSPTGKIINFHILKTDPPEFYKTIPNNNYSTIIYPPDIDKNSRTVDIILN